MEKIISNALTKCALFRSIYHETLEKHSEEILRQLLKSIPHTLSDPAGFGAMTLGFVGTYGHQTAYVISYADNIEAYNKETNEIYNRFHVIANALKIKLEIVPWVLHEDFIACSWDATKEFKAKKLLPWMWRDCVEWTVSKPKVYFNKMYVDEVPMLDAVAETSPVVMIYPQKVISDGTCGATAGQQSLPLEAYKDIKNLSYAYTVFGQHFSKTNDAEKVRELIKSGYVDYIIGEKEATELFGIRGVPHHRFMKIYSYVDYYIGALSTPDWFRFLLFPEKPGLAFAYKGLTDVFYLKDIEKAFAENGYYQRFEIFDENTSLQDLQAKVKRFLRDFGIF